MEIRSDSSLLKELGVYSYPKIVFFFLFFSPHNREICKVSMLETLNNLQNINFYFRDRDRLFLMGIAKKLKNLNFMQVSE
jgi:hypothetical protein